MDGDSISASFGSVDGAAIQAEHVNAVVEAGRKVLHLDGVIAAATVGPIIQILDEAAPAERFLVYIRANGGGEIQAMFELVDCLIRSQADIEIAINRYAMSAAATLWLMFALDPIPGKGGVGRVESVDPLKPTVLLYHRPRMLSSCGQYRCFLENVVDEEMKRSLRQMVDIFDDIFEQLLERQGFSDLHAAAVNAGHAIYKHDLQFAKEAYYSNFDYVIPMKGMES